MEQLLTVAAETPDLIIAEESGAQASELTPNAVLVVAFHHLNLDTDIETLVPSPRRRPSVDNLWSLSLPLTPKSAAGQSSSAIKCKAYWPDETASSPRRQRN